MTQKAQSIVLKERIKERKKEREAKGGEEGGRGGESGQYNRDLKSRRQRAVQEVSSYMISGPNP